VLAYVGGARIEEDFTPLQIAWFKMVHALPWCWTSIESFHFSKGLGRQGACEYGVLDLALHIGAPISKLVTCPEVPNLLQSFAVAKLVK